MIFNYTSQFGEDGIIEEVFKMIGTKNKWCVECGASDGILFSNTRLLIEQGWNSVQIEADENKFNKLQTLYSNNEKVITINRKVTLNVQNNLDSILDQTECPINLDLMVIDVDGQDFHLWNTLFKYRPRVIVVEYDPSKDLEDDFIPVPNGEGQAGFKPIIMLSVTKEYFLFSRTKTNLIFIDNKELNK
jgi:hypothetical protein